MKPIPSELTYEHYKRANALLVQHLHAGMAMEEAIGRVYHEAFCAGWQAYAAQCEISIKHRLRRQHEKYAALLAQTQQEAADADRPQDLHEARGEAQTASGCTLDAKPADETEVRTHE